MTPETGLMERTDAPLPAPGVQEPGSGTRGHGRRLSLRERSLLVQLAEAGKTQTEIAQVLDCAISTVSRTLDQLSDNRQLARRELEAAAPKLVRTIVNSKDAATALRTLGKLDVVREDQASSGAQVVVMIGSSEAPLKPPSIDIGPLSLVPRNNLAGGNEG